MERSQGIGGAPLRGWSQARGAGYVGGPKRGRADGKPAPSLPSHLRPRAGLLRERASLDPYLLLSF